MDSEWFRGEANVSCVNMSKVQQLRAVVKQRITAAAVEIFGLFENMVAEYEEEVSRSKQEIERQRKLLDAVLAAVPPHPQQQQQQQQLVVCDEEVPPQQQDWSSSLDQEDPEPPHVQDQDDLWISQEGEQLQEGPEPPHVQIYIKEEQEELWSGQAGEEFPFSAVPVKAQSSQLHQSQHEEMSEAEPPGCSSSQQIVLDCGGSEPQLNSAGKTSHSSEPDTEDSDDWMETREPQSGSDSQKNSDVIVGKRHFSCSICGRIFAHKAHLKVHMISHTGEKPFQCSICGKGFGYKGNLKQHMLLHTGEKPFICSICGKRFSQNSTLKSHWMVHTGETI